MINNLKQQSRLWDYIIQRKIGKGQYGQVFQVINKNNNQIYALKKMSLTGTQVIISILQLQLQQKQKIQAFKQIKCLKLLSHPSIIQYKESFLSMDNIYIVIQYAQKGDISKIIQSRKKKQKYYNQEQLWNMFQDIIKGVKYLHQKNIIHRDLKLQNIFMTNQNKIKIGDLGMSKILYKETDLITTRVGTPIYFAPQLIRNQLYSFSVDVWALGCIFYYLTMLQHPFQQATLQTLAYYIIDRDLKPIKGQYSNQLISFINSCLTKEANKRPNIYELALKVKNRNRQTILKKNIVSVFNLKKLNKIMNFQQTQNLLNKNQYKQTKIKQHSVFIDSPRKNYVSLNKVGNMNNRKTVSSVSYRDKSKDQHSILSPQSPKSRYSSSIKKGYTLNRPQFIQPSRIFNINQKQSFSPIIKSKGFHLETQKHQINQMNFEEFHQQIQFLNQKKNIIKKPYRKIIH